MSREGIWTWPMSVLFFTTSLLKAYKSQQKSAAPAVFSAVWPSGKPAGKSTPEMNGERWTVFVCEQSLWLSNEALWFDWRRPKSCQKWTLPEGSQTCWKSVDQVCLLSNSWLQPILLIQIQFILPFFYVFWLTFCKINNDKVKNVNCCCSSEFTLF